jgi:indole-3-glycerol phosphate synthase
MSILNEIAAVAKDRVAAAKKIRSSEEIAAAALSLPKGDFAFEKALKEPGLSFICECKKASPSKGIIAEDFPYLDIAKEYEAAGADAISCLTEPKWFLGSDEYLKEIAANVKIPVLRKDFTVDEYMIYEAKIFGASAVLLIMAILTDAQVKEYLSICDKLGLSALVECHDEEEIKRALDCGGRVIGVNNRNLKDFSVDMGLAARLRSLIPEDKVFVSESGIKDINDIAKVKEMGADAVLMGEVLMRSPNKAELLQSFK